MWFKKFKAKLTFVYICSLMNNPDVLQALVTFLTFLIKSPLTPSWVRKRLVKFVLKMVPVVLAVAAKSLTAHSR